jgi:cell wall-associated NlpC family hydrolase
LPIDTQSAGYAQAVARVREIIAPLQPAPATAPATTTGDFAGQLSSAMKPSPGGGAPTTAAGYTTQGVGSIAAAAAAAGGSGRGAQIAAIAQAELGVAEQPPGSNDAPRIAQYRTATAGSGVGPWCAYFTSWVAQQAGVPVGPNGQGIGYVPTVKQWAEQTGRYIPAGAGAPQVGDLVVFERNGDGVLDHIGVVTGTRPDGGIQTVEGNSSDKVSARSYGPGGYAGLVRLVAPGT